MEIKSPIVLNEIKLQDSNNVDINQLQKRTSDKSIKEFSDKK